MIELKNLSKYYNTDNVVTLGLSNVNLKLNKNEIVAIVGDSGAGKSTLLNVICGIDSYDEGELLFKGNETSYFNQADMDNYRKEHIGFIFQNYNILDSYTVLQNVMVPLQVKGYSKKEAKKRAIELIEEVGLSHRIHNKGVKLSGGEKQRCVIARALASDCDILACDEPTGNLDSNSGKEIIDLIHKVSKDKLVLIVTHNYEEVKDIVTRKIKVADGKIVEDVKLIEVQEDANEVITFIDKKVKPSTIFEIGFQNILSTPKKTIFTFIVFVILSLIAFFLYLSCMASSQVSFFDPDSQFVNYENNRLIAYQHDHTGIDSSVLDDISGKYYVNAFYEDSLFTLKFYKNTPTNTVGILRAAYTSQPLTYKHIAGSELKNEQDGYIIFPKPVLDDYSIEYSSVLKQECNILLENLNLKFVGFGTSEYISKPVIQLKKDYSKYIGFQAIKNDLKLELTIPSLDTRYTLNARKTTTSGKLTVYIPSSLKGYESEFDFHFLLKDLYSIHMPQDYEISYTFSNNFYFTLPSYMELDYAAIYELTVYTDNPTKEVKKLESFGLNVIRPSVDFKEVSKNQLLFYTYVLISTVIVFVFCFVSYIVLSRVYISKNKDYAVLRTLGVVKKNMGHIVIIEITFISFLASLFSFALIYILYYSFRLEYLNVITYNNFGISALYYVVILLFSYFIARRFNKRLFKFTAQHSLKSEVIKND